MSTAETNSFSQIGDLNMQAAQPNALAAAGLDFAYGSSSLSADNRKGVSQLADTGLKIFDRVDQNHDGYIERSELAKAIQDPYYKGREAQTVAALYRAQLPMYAGAGHWDNGTWGGFKITRSDIERWKTIEAEYPQKLEVLKRIALGNNEFMKFINERYPNISKKDFETLAKNSKLSPEEKQLAQFCAKHVGFLTESGNSVDELVTAFSKQNDVTIYRKVNSVLNLEKRFPSAGASSELYANKEHPIKSIRADAVRQGIIGNCYFEAALANIAEHNPEAVLKMIKDNKDGTCTVTFPGAADEPITVAKPTEAEQYTYNGKSPDGTWVNVLEKAYGTYCQKYFWRRNFLSNNSGGRTPTEGADGGGWWGALKMLTGTEVEPMELSKATKAAVAKSLEDAFGSHPPKPVIAATNFHADNSFVRRHMYSVLSYKPGRNGGTVTIRNPWGQPDERTDFSANGIYEIPLEVYMRNFDKQAIGK